VCLVILITAAGCTSSPGQHSPTSAAANTIAAETSIPIPLPLATSTLPQTAQICPLASHHSVEILNRLPHDASAYTQGLLFLNGYFYESTGLLGQSSLRKVDPATGEVLQKQALPSDLFGEGLALVNNHLIQLTWKNNRALVYQQDNLNKVAEFSYPGEGWGLTFDGRQIIMSDGSASLRFLDPDSFKEQYRLTVLDGNTPVERINELEMVNGKILANIWQTSQIIAIDPNTGCITAWINLDELVREATLQPDAEVLNGIAYDLASGRLWVTGKFWNTVYEIKIQPGLNE
jgi:glutamine cyclotransferase